MRRLNSVFQDVDWITILIYLTLVMCGWISIYSAVYNPEHQSIFDMSQRYGKQILWIGISAVVGAIILFIESGFFRKGAILYYMISMLLLIVVLVIGDKTNGATSWFEVGGFKVQPSEIAKSATALTVATVISMSNFRMMTLRSMMIVGAVIISPLILILLQNDTGSALVYFSFAVVLYREGMNGSILMLAVTAVVLFVLSMVLHPAVLDILLVLSTIAIVIYQEDGSRTTLHISGVVIASILIGILLNYLLFIELPEQIIVKVIASLSAVIILIRSILSKEKTRFRSYIMVAYLSATLFIYVTNFAYKTILADYQQDRIEVMMGLKSDPQGKGYNLNQSLIAIGSGGVSGKGFLEGTQTKYNFVPEQSTDFIFCTVGEEWGFLGSLFVITMFVILFGRLIYLAERQRSKYSRVYGYSVVAILFIHFAINIGMTIGLAPVIGIPLPFFSYGGSSLIFFTILLFIFLRFDADRRLQFA